MFKVLGGVRVESHGTALPLRGQVRRLLGILLADHDQSVGTEVLIDRLWPQDSAPATARKIVQVLTVRLRQALERDADAGGAHPRLTTTEDGYLLEGGPEDLARYEVLLGRAEAVAGTEPRAALAALDEAFDLWGRPWGAQGEESWLAPRVATIEERHHRAEELWADLALETGRAATAVDRLRAAVVREPYRERRWAQLMLATYRDGRQVEALRIYDEAGELLRELGLDPGPELQRLRLAVLEHDTALQARRPRATDVFGATSFVGRDGELAQLATDLAKHRLVTVVGIGGVGKTRLVDEYAHAREVAGDDVRRATFASAPDGVGAAIHLASELGLGTDARSDREAVDLVAASLGREPSLLLLDGMEHASGASAVALRLIDRCARLRVLATSRVPLGVQAERTLNLQPLPIGAPGAPESGTALELLLDRAGIGTGALDDEARAELGRRAEATGGIPLLIELAAPSALEPSRPEEVSAVVGDDRGAIREAIGHALRAVDERACELASDAAVLPGGVGERTAAALRGVPDDVAHRALRQLAWVNLMNTRAGLDGVRYQSLDPVREALVPSGEDDRDRAIDRVVRAVEEVFHAFAPSPTLPHVSSVLDAAEDEHANLRFLLAHQLRAKPHRALDLAVTASEFWASRGFSVEGRRWIQDAIDAARPVGPRSWEASLALARTTRTFAEISLMRDELEALVAEMRAEGADWVHLAGGLTYLAISRGWSGDAPGAVAMLDEVEPLIERSGTEWGRVLLERLRGLSLAATGDLLGARRVQRSAVPRLIELGDPYTAGQAAYLSAALGDMAGRDDVLDDIRVARELATTVRDVSLLGQLLLIEARALRRAGDGRSRELFADAAERLMGFGGIRAASLAYRDLGLLELADGDARAATDHLRRSLVPLLRLDRPAAAPAVGAFAVLCHRTGDEHAASFLLGFAEALHEIDAPTWTDDARLLAELAESIGMARSERSPVDADDDALLELLGLD